MGQGEHAHHRLPENVKGVQFWLDLLNASGVKGTAETVLHKLFDENRVVMNFSVAAGLSSLAKLAPAYYPQMRSVPPPWPGNKAIERLHPVIVNNKSKYIPEAMALVKYLVTPANLYWITVQNGYPVIPYTNFGEHHPGVRQVPEDDLAQGLRRDQLRRRVPDPRQLHLRLRGAREHHLFQPREGRFGQRHRHSGAAGRSGPAGVSRTLHL